MTEKPETPANELPPLRRIVTGHDSGNVAKVLKDGAPDNRKLSSTGAVSTAVCHHRLPAAQYGIGPSH